MEIVPNWNYTVEEVSMGVYQLKASDDQGRSVDLTGTDHGELIEESIEAAKRMNFTSQLSHQKCLQQSRIEQAY